MEKDFLPGPVVTRQGVTVHQSSTCRAHQPTMQNPDTRLLFTHMVHIYYGCPVANNSSS